MLENLYQENEKKLRLLMGEVGIADIKELSRLSGVSQLQLLRMLYGLLPKFNLETVTKIAKTLQIPIDKLIATFTVTDADYIKIEEQKQNKEEEFIQATLETIESWLVQWPSVVAAIENKPDIPAANLLPLIKPVEQLIENWGIKAIGYVGEEVDYEPQKHELMEGIAQDGERVKIRYVGYCQGEKLLYRAKVSRVES